MLIQEVRLYVRVAFGSRGAKRDCPDRPLLKYREIWELSQETFFDFSTYYTHSPHLFYTLTNYKNSRHRLDAEMFNLGSNLAGREPGLDTGKK